MLLSAKNTFLHSAEEARHQASKDYHQGVAVNTYDFSHGIKECWDKTLEEQLIVDIDTVVCDSRSDYMRLLQNMAQTR